MRFSNRYPRSTVRNKRGRLIEVGRPRKTMRGQCVRATILRSSGGTVTDSVSRVDACQAGTVGQRVSHKNNPLADAPTLRLHVSVKCSVPERPALLRLRKDRRSRRKSNPPVMSQTKTADRSGRTRNRFQQSAHCFR